MSDQEEFKRGQKVYDNKGGEYLYSDRVEDGHYVSTIIINQVINYAGDDFDEIEEEGPLVFLKSVFSEPPKQKINDEITRLSEEKSKLATHVTDLQREERKLVSEIEGYKAKLEAEVRKYPHHKMFLHAASGGDLVVVDINSWEIKTPDSAIRFDVKTGRFTNVEFVESFNGMELEHREHSYIAFVSKAEAGAYFLRNAELTFDVNDVSWGGLKNPKNLAEKYREFGLLIPSGLQSVLDDRESAKKLKRKESLEKTISEATEQLEEIKGAS